ncbi:sigma-E processing peptidase SpoIIGA [Clostridium baratii]|uniref:sigma-E processing peptidase SpoIIGA n=1 Tax=Clostridium baratii TaxID=1561 RepID=UPI000699918F|nr:sigma-E processing peptidase SpoIIGA [Clostridium baratii]
MSKVEIYVDVLILENFIVNLFLLTVTFKILRESYSFKKGMISALLGGIYTLTMLFKWSEFLSNNIFQVLAAIILVYIPIKNKKISNVLKASATFILCSCILSGICFKIAYETNPYSIKNGILIDNFKLKYLILCIIIIFITVDRITTYIREKNIINNFFYDIEINFENNIINVKGFLDSGNELREPVTNLPCILIEENYLSSINIYKLNPFSIPYSAIGYNGSLKGIRVNNIKLKKEGKIFKEINAIICPCKDTLSRDNEFNALLSRGVM